MIFNNNATTKRNEACVSLYWLYYTAYIYVSYMHLLKYLLNYVLKYLNNYFIS